jgi:hypothetical protein
MKILVSIASGANNTERNVLRSFYEGIERYYFQLFAVNNQRMLKKQHGIDLRMSYDTEIESCDIAVQFGTVKPRSAEHHVTRQSIQKKAEQVIYIETPLLGRTIVEGSNGVNWAITDPNWLSNRVLGQIFYPSTSLQSGTSIFNMQHVMPLSTEVMFERADIKKEFNFLVDHLTDFGRSKYMGFCIIKQSGKKTKR